MSNWNEGVLDRSNTKLFTRNILRNVYVWMAIALGITAIVSWGVSQSEISRVFIAQAYVNGHIVSSPTMAMWVVWISQLVIVFALAGLIMKMPPAVAVLVFTVYAVLMGIGLSGIFIMYPIGSIFKAFFGAAIMFGVMSAYGIMTKRDLTSWGTFLYMALIGLIIASVINLLLGSTVMDYIISFVGIIIFTGLTAYDTQKIKQMSESYGSNINEADYVRLSIVGALNLYLDFINIFVMLLRLFGDRR